MRVFDPHDNLSRPNKFRCIVVDPPWQHRDKYGKRGARAKYRTLPLEKIIWHPYRDIVMAPRDAVLLLWRLSSMQTEALRLAEAWSFDVKAELVWNKLTKNGLEHFGTGHYVRNSHETCLICVRGRATIKDHSTRSTFQAAVGEHSAKPDRFFRIAQRLFPGPRLELFSRQARAGWTCLGNQVRL